MTKKTLILFFFIIFLTSAFCKRVKSESQTNERKFLRMFNGGITTSGRQIEKDGFANETSLDLRWASDNVSFDSRISGSYEPSVTESQKMDFKTTEKLFNVYTKYMKASIGDIRPEFSEYTLSSLSNKGGVEVELDCQETYFRPVYLILQEPDENNSAFGRKLSGASLTKKGLPLGLSLGFCGYRNSDDKNSINDWKENKPAEITTLGTKIELVPVDGLELSGEFAQSENDFDITDTTMPVKDDAYKFGMNINLDRWNISSRYSVCNKNFVAAGTESVDSDKNQYGVNIGYNFSDYINTTLSETRIIDGLSEGIEKQIKTQNSSISLGISPPKLPSITTDLRINKNTNFFRTTDDENTEFSTGLSYMLPGYLLSTTLNGNMNTSNFTDHTKRSNDTLTDSYSGSINTPLKLWVLIMMITPNFSLTEDRNKVTGNITKYENYTTGLMISFWSSRISTNMTIGRNISSDTQKSTDTEGNSTNVQVAGNIINNLKLTMGYNKNQNEDRINSTNNKTVENLSFSTTFIF